MPENPYNFTGPLHPDKDRLVCIRREKELESVINGILRGDYWTILGPRQIGKTTLLNQIVVELSGLSCIYFDMEVCPDSEKMFYEWIMADISNRVASQVDLKPKPDFGPELNFYNFLRSVHTEGNKKLVLFFDEIEKTPNVKSFLHLWRKIFNERNFSPELNKYAVIIAGSVDLISLTIGPTSPFNISKKLYLAELTKTEAEQLIDEPMRELGIELATNVKHVLITQTACHPQLLQQLCYLLVQYFFQTAKPITKNVVEQAIEKLFTESDNLNALNREVQADEKLKKLIMRILQGRKDLYLPNQDYSIAGTGPIIQYDEYCGIRNKIYEDFLAKVIKQHPDKSNGIDKETEYIIRLYLKEFPQPSFPNEADESLIQYLFLPENQEIEILKDNQLCTYLKLGIREKLLFCYLAYLNYKAIQINGISHWKKIPESYKYRLSSNIDNNKNHQIPEWEIFVQALGKEPFGDDIRSWIFSLRHSLATINAADIIPKDSGRGRGYLLKGKVFIEIRK